MRIGYMHAYRRVALPRDAQLGGEVRGRLLMPRLVDAHLGARHPRGERSVVLPEGELPDRGALLQASDDLVEACAVVRSCGAISGEKATMWW